MLGLVVAGISTAGISPRSTSPDSRTLIRRVGGHGGRCGGGSPMKGNAGGKLPLGNQSATRMWCQALLSEADRPGQRICADRAARRGRRGGVETLRDVKTGPKRRTVMVDA